jgi:signal peptidase I
MEYLVSMNWKPKGWIAILIGIIFQPFAFLYVNRPKLFWCYLGASGVITGIDYLLHKNLAVGSLFEYAYLSWAFFILCPVHAYKITKFYDVSQLRNWYTRWWAIPSIYASYFIPLFLFRAFLFEPFSIPASSMSPTINIGDYVIVKKWGFGGYSTYGIDVMDSDLSDKSLVQRGKIYVFISPNSESPFIKRLIGLPGDLIEIKGDVILVNGDILSSEFVSDSGKGKIYREEYGKNSYLIQRFTGRPFSVTSTIEVSDNQYFFLGDNRDNSADSRIWGTVSGADFVGELIYVF